MSLAGLYDSIDSRVWQQHWQVDVLPVADGRAALKYLAPYVFRVAISDNRIEQVTDTHVTYRFTPERPAGCCAQSVPDPFDDGTGEAFTRSFLQHVLPSRFQKVRHYGFWGSNCHTNFELVRMLVWFYVGWFYYLTSHRADPEPAGRSAPSAAV